MYEPGCLSIDEWNKTMLSMYITRYCFAIMKNEIRTFAGSWIELQIIYSFYRKISVEFLNLLKSPQEGDYGRKEKN
jgi:hypothetical protein